MWTEADMWVRLLWPHYFPSSPPSWQPGTVISDLYMNCDVLHCPLWLINSGKSTVVAPIASSWLHDLHTVSLETDRKIASIALNLRKITNLNLNACKWFLQPVTTTQICSTYLSKPNVSNIRLTKIELIVTSHFRVFFKTKPQEFRKKNYPHRATPYTGETKKNRKSRQCISVIYLKRETNN